MIDLPEGPFNIVYADPPWQFKNYSDKWHEGKKQSRWVGNEYGLMTQQEIEQLPVAEITADDAVCFLWATFPTLPRALSVLSHWGFTYKTVAFVWHKTTKHNKDHVGMGFWTRSNAEIVLLGTRGHPHRLSKSVRQIVHATIGRHSAKPPEIRDRIVSLIGDVPRVELFARETTPGWASWGDEI